MNADDSSNTLSSSSSKKAVIIYNPFAGRGKSANIAQQTKSHLNKNGWQACAIVATEYAGHVEKVLAEEWAHKVQLIVLVGGDGTLRELVSGLWTKQLKVNIGFIPMGNANVVARELAIPLQAEAAIQLLTTGEPKRVDICILKQENQADLIFLAMLEIGFGAKVVKFVDQLRNGSLKRLYQFWGDLVYAIAGTMALKNLGRDSFTATTFTSTQSNAQESVSKSTTHCVIANMQTYAKGWSLTPDARCDDGLIYIAISQKNSPWSILSVFFAASQKRKLKPSLMSYKQIKQVHITGKSSLFVQVDGDPIAFSGKADISIEKEAFSILVIPELTRS